MHQNNNMTMSYLFYSQLERVLNILVYSLTPTRYRHRRFDRNRYYRTLLQWDICSNRYVVNRSLFPHSFFSQASLHSLAALSSNQLNSHYSTNYLIRGELPILSTQGIASDVNPILSSIARSIGLTTHSAAVTNGLVILILREMVRRGPPEGIPFSSYTEEYFRDSLNSILQSVFTGHHEDPQSGPECSSPINIPADFTPESSNAAANHTSFHSQVDYAPESSNAACNHSSFISPVPFPDLTNYAPESSNAACNHSSFPEINQSCLYSSSESSTSTSSSSSLNSASSGESYLSVLRELLSSPEFISMCLMLGITIYNLLASPDIAPADAFPPGPSTSEVTGSQVPSTSEVRGDPSTSEVRGVPSTSEVRGGNDQDHISCDISVGNSTKSMIISGIVLLTIIWFGLSADGLDSIDPQLAFPT